MPANQSWFALVKTIFVNEKALAVCRYRTANRPIEIVKTKIRSVGQNRSNFCGTTGPIFPWQAFHVFWSFWNGRRVVEWTGETFTLERAVGLHLTKLRGGATSAIPKGEEEE